MLGPVEHLEIRHNTCQGIALYNALSQMREVYLSLMERCPPLVNLHYPTFDSLPTHSRCHGGSVLKVSDSAITIIMGTPLYSVTVRYYYDVMVHAYYECYAHLDDRLYVPLASIHNVYGVGSLLSGVEMVVQYCEENAKLYNQCPRCKYSDNLSSYCGQGLEMHTGNCMHQVPRY